MMNNTEMQERQKMLWGYVEAVQASRLEFSTKGKYVDGVFFFLSHAEEVSKRGYKKFMKTHATEGVYLSHMGDAIRDFLAHRGVGFKTVEGDLYKRDNSRVASKLEKREVKQKDTIDKFITWLKNERDYSESTLRIYATTIRDYYSYFDDFNVDNCRKYVGELGNLGRSPKTIRIHITCLERFGTFLKKPVKMKRPKVTATLSTDNIPTEKEYERLLEYVDQHDEKWAFIIRLLATTGARVSELVQFTYEMVQQGYVVLKGKGSKYRQFFFTKQMQKMAAGKTGIVCMGRTGKPLSKRGIDDRLKRFGNAVGISKEKMHPHAFRHFFAKMYLKKTKDVVGLADILGHESVDTTRLYLQKSKEEQKRSFNRAVTW